MPTLDELVQYCKNTGYIFQGSEIYGGLANTWDYGYLGSLLKRNIKEAWLLKFQKNTPNNVLLDGSILMNPNVWVASGHVGGFSDPLIECKNCNQRFRADKLLYDFDKTESDGWSKEKFEQYIFDHKVNCPNCDKHQWTEIRSFNMMFETNQGVVQNSLNKIYLRPENAQNIFVQFKNIQRTTRKKIPFGICQIGKAFRNEITPGNFIFRTREFEQMELEFFCQPGTELDWFKYYKNECLTFLSDLGLKKENLKLVDHTKEQLSFYSNATTDIQYNFPWGFDELWGIASRTDYDLKSHEKHTGVDLSYLDPITNEKYHPYVVEPSVGVERLILAFLNEALETETLENGTTREVLRIHPFLAPYKVAVLPLVRKDHDEKALEIYNKLSEEFDVYYDETQNIGKRYRRQDQIGTPFAVTIDHQTLIDDTITLRYRDDMSQIRLKVEELISHLKPLLKF
ncbi:MAG: glycine--tRNA ligase [Acholeplasmataceae bacterium]|nr:glycine--tRNA ligase [Acholeplasmataceae bacterium]